MSEIKPIKICHLSSVHFALDTRIFYRMCKHLSHQYEVHLIAVHPSEELREKVYIHPFKRYHNRKLRILFGWLIMFFKAIKVNARVYHLHDPELIPCGMLLRLMGKKVILDIHENIAEDIFDKPWIRNQKFIFRIFSFFEMIACRMFYIVLAETSYEKRYRSKAKNCYTILNYCDLDFFSRFNKTSYNHGLNLYYIGIILENRGILQIAEAIHQLKQEGYQANFHCVGELYSDLDRKIKQLPYYGEIQDQLHFYGRLPLEEGYEISKDMDIGMCIIWPMKNSVESYPTKLFEYMSIGLPIISSNFPLYRKTVEGNFSGICVDPLNPTEIKNAILAIHTDVEKSELMAKSGKLAVKNQFNWESQTRVLTRVYEDIL